LFDQPGLAGRGQRRLPEAGLDEHLALRQIPVQVVVPTVGAGSVRLRFHASVVAGLTHDNGRQAQAERGVGDADEESFGP
jgi:hypothetical protein